MLNFSLLLLVLGLFEYASGEEGFCSAPSSESKPKPLYWKVDNPTLSPIHLQDLPGFTRSVYKSDHALITPESQVYSPLPDWINTSGAYLVTPEMGSHFVMFLAKLKENSRSGLPPHGVERLIFVLQGGVTLTTAGNSHILKVDSYAYLPPNFEHSIESDSPATIVVFERRYAPLQNLVPEPVVSSTDRQPLLETPGEIFELRKLLPTSLAYDFNIHDRTSGKMIGSAKMMDGLYYFEDISEDKIAQGFSGISSMPIKDQIILWHNRLGHPSFPYLKHLFPNLFKNIDSSLLKCESCIRLKSHRAPYYSQPYHASKPFHLIHSDVWGPSKITTQFGKKWFVTFIDDHTRLCWIYLMHEKSEVSKIFQYFSTMVETQFDTKISILRSDNGTEYFNKNLGEFLQKKGIQHQSTCPNTPQQNGIAERKNKHLLEVARAIMFEGNVPKYLWGDAVLTAAYLINRMPTRVLNYCTPLDTFKKNFPACRLHSDLPLKVFGCTVFLHTPSYRSKLDPRAEKCIFIGYSPSQKGYKCFNPHTKKFHVSMDVTFLEHETFFQKNSLQEESLREENFLHEPLPTPILHIEDTTSTNQVNSETIAKQDVKTNSEIVPELVGIQTGKEIPQEKELRCYVRKYPKKTREQPIISVPAQSENPEDGPTIVLQELPGKSEIVTSNNNLPIALRKETRTCTKKVLKNSTNHPISNYVSYQNLSQKHRAFTSKITNLFEPRNIEEALDDPNWKLAVMEEWHALKKNETWEIVDLPQNTKLVGCRWVFTIKCNADGSIERYKARLVARGYTQTYGVDYRETFAPVAKLSSVRILLSLAANYNWPLHQLDIKNAFLNGELEEEVFMKLPPGFEAELGRNKVCKLKKSLYGLKQSPRAWFERLGMVVKGLGYTQSQADHTLFYKHSAANQTAILIVYVDDIILTGDDFWELKDLKEKLAKAFEIKELGSLKYFLGIEFARSKEGIFMNQRKYILDLLKETGLLGCKAAETPIEPNLKLKPAEPENVMDKGRYQRLVGRLIYLSHTRPDIAFAVSMVSQFMHSPGQEHMDAVFRILRYLKGSPGKGLLYKKHGHLQVEAYTDADWAGNVMDRRSTSGYCTFVGGNLVSWRSKKQSVVARSSAEAEFRAVAHGICEALWVEKILQELKVSISPPMRLYCDNKSAISISHNPVLHDRTKHVEVDKHFIREKIERGQICISYVPTTEQLADVLTKGLPKKTFDSIISKLSMNDIFKPA
ncbi:retrovirus-related Pol polyprotein from transposon RE1 isoform X1 [Arachis stenosperma]|uniref:retrovirus-related Pol polyprotein from transposon RE1 isoform X1 n=1 Tax=Arachis stenosperma TaxID=217475 RepID=UPI0025ACA34D|nr:retrovirus-related Pol polyprotein from transposon RE1 isoform X1 [Arachis stenosperma]